MTDFSLSQSLNEMRKKVKNRTKKIHQSTSKERVQCSMNYNHNLTLHKWYWGLIKYWQFSQIPPIWVFFWFWMMESPQVVVECKQVLQNNTQTLGILHKLKKLSKVLGYVYLPSPNSYHNCCGSRTSRLPGKENTSKEVTKGSRPLSSQQRLQQALADAS